MSLEHWEAYYRGGLLATCPTDAGGGYDRELREAWVEFFAGLPDGARVLDVGTGNGAVALIASETAAATGRRFEIHGTDLALIDPPRHVPDGARRFAGVRFHPRIATERLPFEPASIDAVSGQYALEYAAVPAALAEIARVLRPGGRARFILHHAESVLARNAHASLEQAQLVLRETKVYARLRRHLAAERESPAAAGRTWQDLGAAATRLQQALAAAPGALVLRVTLDAVQKLLAARQQLPTAALDREVDRVESDLRASVRRLVDLVERARGEDDMQAIEREAAAAGLAVEERCRQLHGGDNLVGWRLTLLRT